MTYLQGVPVVTDLLCVTVVSPRPILQNGALRQLPAERERVGVGGWVGKKIQARWGIFHGLLSGVCVYTHMS